MYQCLEAMDGQHRPIRYCIHQLKEMQSVSELRRDNWTEETNKVSNTPAKNHAPKCSVCVTKLKVHLKRRYKVQLTDDRLFDHRYGNCHEWQTASGR